MIHITSLLLLIFTLSLPLVAQESHREEYNQALSLYNAEEYDGIVPLLSDIYNLPEADWRVYHVYSMGLLFLEKPDSATAVLSEAIARFPEEGKLYAEQGQMYRTMKRPIDAIEVWERGIEADPMEWLTYYYAANHYYSSNDMVWGLVYAELAFFLADNEQGRSVASSTLLQALTRAIPQRLPGGGWHIQAITDEYGGQNGVMLFGVEVQKALADATDSVGYDPKKGLTTPDIAKLIELRSRFLDIWFASDSERPEVPLFTLLRMIQKEGHLDTYSRLALQFHDPTSLRPWLTANEEEVRAMGAFLQTLSPPIGKTSVFNRDAMREAYGME